MNKLRSISILGICSIQDGALFKMTVYLVIMDPETEEPVELENNELTSNGLHLKLTLTLSQQTQLTDITN